MTILHIDIYILHTCQLSTGFMKGFLLQVKVLLFVLTAVGVNLLLSIFELP